MNKDVATALNAMLAQTRIYDLPPGNTVGTYAAGNSYWALTSVRYEGLQMLPSLRSPFGLPPSQVAQQTRMRNAKAQAAEGHVASKKRKHDQLYLDEAGEPRVIGDVEKRSRVRRTEGAALESSVKRSLQTGLSRYFSPTQ